MTKLMLPLLASLHLVACDRYQIVSGTAVGEAFRVDRYSGEVVHCQGGTCQAWPRSDLGR